MPTLNLIMTEDNLEDLTDAELVQVQALAVGRFLRLGSVPMPEDTDQAAEVLRMADRCVTLTKAAAKVMRRRANPWAVR